VSVLTTIAIGSVVIWLSWQLLRAMRAATRREIDPVDTLRGTGPGRWLAVALPAVGVWGLLTGAWTLAAIAAAGLAMVALAWAAGEGVR